MNLHTYIFEGRPCRAISYNRQFTKVTLAFGNGEYRLLTMAQFGKARFARCSCRRLANNCICPRPREELGSVSDRDHLDRWGNASKVYGTDENGQNLYGSDEVQKAFLKFYAGTIPGFPDLEPATICAQASSW